MGTGEQNKCIEQNNCEKKKLKKKIKKCGYDMRQEQGNIESSSNTIL